MSDSLQPHGLQHTRLPCPSPSPRVAQTHVHWVSQTIKPSHPLSPPSLPALNLSQHQGIFQWVGSSHQVAKSIWVSASVPQMYIQDWFSWGLTGLISLLPKGLSWVFSNITVWKHQFFRAQPSLWSYSHIGTWPLERNNLFTCSIELFPSCSAPCYHCPSALIVPALGTHSVLLHFPQDGSPPASKGPTEPLTKLNPCRLEIWIHFPSCEAWETSYFKSDSTVPQATVLFHSNDNPSVTLSGTIFIPFKRSDRPPVCKSSWQRRLLGAPLFRILMTQIHCLTIPLGTKAFF